MSCDRDSTRVESLAPVCRLARRLGPAGDCIRQQDFCKSLGGEVSKSLGSIGGLLHRRSTALPAHQQNISSTSTASTFRRLCCDGERRTPRALYMMPHALHSVCGPAGPRRIIGVSASAMPQFMQRCTPLATAAAAAAAAGLPRCPCSSGSLRGRASGTAAPALIDRRPSRGLPPPSPPCLRSCRHCSQLSEASLFLTLQHEPAVMEVVSRDDAPWRRRTRQARWPNTFRKAEQFAHLQKVRQLVIPVAFQGDLRRQLTMCDALGSLIPVA